MATVYCEHFVNFTNVSTRIARTLREHTLLASLRKVFTCVLLPFFLTSTVCTNLWCICFSFALHLDLQKTTLIVSHAATCVTRTCAYNKMATINFKKYLKLRTIRRRWSALQIKSKLLNQTQLAYNTSTCSSDILVKFPSWCSTNQQQWKYIGRMTPSETHNPDMNEGKRNQM